MESDSSEGSICPYASSSSSIDSDVLTILRDYSEDLSVGYQSLTKYYSPFSSSIIHPKLKEYIRFNPELEIKIAGIPQNDLLEILKQRNEDLVYLVEKTDIFRDNQIFNIDCIKNYDSFLKKELEAALNTDQLEKVIDVAKNHFVIRTTNFLSLFIEEGVKLRQYYKINGKEENPDDIAQISRLKGGTFCIYNTLYKPISIKGLTLFAQKTGISDIKKMIGQVTELSDFLKINSDPKKIKDGLFRRLKQYHPELIIE